MLGRIKPIWNLMDRDARATYKAHACGVCVAIKDRYGRRAALGHSCELVFLSLLLEGLSEEPYATGRRACTVIPFVPKRVKTAPPEHAAAAAGCALAALKVDLADARRDNERKLKRWFCGPCAKIPGRIDPAKVSEWALVRDCTRNLPPGEAAGTVAGVFASTFQLAGLREELVKTGCRIGGALGRLMELADALEDYFEDLRRGRPNPLRRPDESLVAAEISARLHAALDEITAQVKPSHFGATRCSSRRSSRNTPAREQRRF